ncbi:MAG: hypothetical protein AABO57_03040 [Acidobacteriota bacterium]
MQRLNRSGHAPKGPAFFLFLGLAIVPLSLRAAGFQVSFNPSLSAASDAWQQIADVFGAGYQPARTSDLAMPSDSGREPLKADDDSACPPNELACARENVESSGSVQDVPPVLVVKASSERGKCPAAASRSSASASRVELGFAAAAIVQRGIESAAIQIRLQKHARAFEALSAIKLETVTREELLKNIEKRMVERSFETVKTLPIRQGFRMFVRVKPPVTPSATKSAETRVRAALASARGLELERACLTSAPPAASPDNGEL